MKKISKKVLRTVALIATLSTLAFSNVSYSGQLLGTLKLKEDLLWHALTVTETTTMLAVGSGGHGWAWDSTPLRLDGDFGSVVFDVDNNKKMYEELVRVFTDGQTPKYSIIQQGLCDDGGCGGGFDKEGEFLYPITGDTTKDLKGYSISQFVYNYVVTQDTPFSNTSVSTFSRLNGLLAIYINQAIKVDFLNASIVLPANSRDTIRFEPIPTNQPISLNAQFILNNAITPELANYETKWHINYNNDDHSYLGAAATVTIKLDQGLIDLLLAENARAAGIWHYDYNVKQWEWLGGTISDTDNTLTFATRSFSEFVIGYSPSIPEPATISLLTLGFAGMARFRRRKTQA